MAEKKTSRKQQALEMKEKIQSEAIRLFDEKGFENVSMEEIAEAAGCSVGNIYHYFKGKQSLTTALTHYVDNKYQTLFDKYFSGNCKMTAEEKYVDFAAEALKIDSGEELLYQCFVHSIKHPEQGVLRFDSEEMYPKIIKRITEELAEENSLREGVNADSIFHQFVIINRGILLQWRIEEGGFDIAAEGRRMAENLLDGIIER